jgi:hypothetical protein
MRKRRQHYTWVAALLFTIGCAGNWSCGERREYMSKCEKVLPPARAREQCECMVGYMQRWYPAYKSYTEAARAQTPKIRDQVSKALDYCPANDEMRKLLNDTDS